MPPTGSLAGPAVGQTALGRTASLLGTAGILVTGALAVLQPLPDRPPVPVTAQSPGPDPGLSCALGPDGYLEGRFFGAFNLSVAWSGSTLACDGMHKPDGEGVRLFFAGERPDGGRVALLVGLDGLLPELAGTERPANVTVIDERDGRFFSAAGRGRCWARIGSVTPVRPAPGRGAGHRIDGLVYCLGALPSVGDRSSLTLSDLRFSGWVASDAD